MEHPQTLTSTQEEQSFEAQKFWAELEEKRAHREADTQKHALDHKAKLLEIEGVAGRSFKLAPAQATALGAAFTLIGGVTVAFIQSLSSQTVSAETQKFQMEIEKMKAERALDMEKQKIESAERLERQKFETTLILKAIDTIDRDAQIGNLKFFVETGFISDKDGKIRKMSPDQLPSRIRATGFDNYSFAFDSGNFDVDKELVRFIGNFEGQSPDLYMISNLRDKISSLVKVPLNQNQINALISFAYNAGLNKLISIGIFQKINSHDLGGAKSAIVNEGNSKLPGIKRRREMEAELFVKPVSDLENEKK